MSNKQPFDIDLAMDGIRESVRAFRKAALFELFEDGFTSPFEQLMACMISIRTRDEDTVPIARRLFAQARTPEAVAACSVAEIDRLISGSTFHEAKAPQIHEIARRTVAEHGGNCPATSKVFCRFAALGSNAPTSCSGSRAVSHAWAWTFTCIGSRTVGVMSRRPRPKRRPWR